MTALLFTLLTLEVANGQLYCEAVSPLPRQMLAAQAGTQNFSTQIPQFAPSDSVTLGTATGLEDTRAINRPFYVPLDVRNGFFQRASAWVEGVPSSGNDFGYLCLGGAITFAIPLNGRDDFLLLSPSVVNYWTGGPAEIDVPERLYDFSCDLRWFHRLGNRTCLLVGVRPGIFSDLHQETDEALRTAIYGAALLDLAPRFAAVLGCAYLDRDDVKVLPVAGLLWQPRESLKFELVPPRPRVALRVAGDFAAGSKTELWVYLAGQFNGGIWAVEVPGSGNDVLQYRDFRLLAGIERNCFLGTDVSVEAGFVLGRKLQLLSNNASTVPDPTALVRIALSY